MNILKTYKEINEEIEVSEELKQKTISLMTSHKAPRKYRILRYATCCIVVILSIVGVTKFQQQKVEPSKLAVDKQEEDNFRIDDYTYEGNYRKTGNADAMSDIAGEVLAMNQELRKEIKGHIPELTQLDIPSQFQSTVLYNQYEYHTEEEMIGPYAVVSYQIIKNENEYIYVYVQDDRIGVCMPLENVEKLPTYKDYHLSIVRNISDNGDFIYCVDAYHDGYTIHMNAALKDEKSFVRFLKSFLI